MACHHSNPAGYVFCSACGQALEYRQCRCGFICAPDALYCGRCGHSLIATETEDETTVSAVEHRYDLDLLVQLAGVHPSDKRPNINEAKAIKVDQNETSRVFTAIKNSGNEQ